MRTTPFMAGVLMASLGLGSCANNQQTGTVAGGVIGAVVGAQFGNSSSDRALAAIGGAAAGALIGNWIGGQLDEADRQRHLAAVQSAARNQRSESWSNPSNNTSGTVASVEPLSARPGCYSSDDTITVNGQAKSSRNTYCTQSNGTLAFAN
jgi:osmotically inducible lipoprotein OsmB